MNVAKSCKYSCVSSGWARVGPCPMLEAIHNSYSGLVSTKVASRPIISSARAIAHGTSPRYLSIHSSSRSICSIVAWVPGRPIAMHGRGHVIGEERTERRSAVLQLLCEQVEGEHRLERSTPRTHPWMSPLGQQLPGQRGEGARSDADPGGVAQESQRGGTRDRGVDVAGRRSDHPQVEFLEGLEFGRKCRGFQGERVRQVEAVGRDVLRRRVTVQRRRRCRRRLRHCGAAARQADSTRRPAPGPGRNCRSCAARR